MHKKIANNMLEFLIDPTVIPVEKRLYIGPEEKLQNQFYEQAKADSFKAYGTERHNSDFYPTRNRQQSKREASVMDRKSIIASLDILSQNFTDEDPISKELKVMAEAVNEMTDEQFALRLAANTFKCPECGTKVLQQTGYCVKCKKKVKEACDEKPAAPPAEAPAEKKEEAPAKTAADLLGGWNVRASDAVRKVLLASAEGDDDPAPAAPAEEKKADQNSPHPQLQSAPVAPAPEAAPAEKVPEAEKAPEAEKVPEEKKAEEAPVIPAPAVPAPAAPAPEEKKDEKKEEKKDVVNADMLASAQYEGINLTAGMMTAEDIQISDEELSKLNQVLAATGLDKMSPDTRKKYDSLYK